MNYRSLPVHILRLWMDPRVSRTKKIIFPLLIGVYWLLPDLMPFVPLDDIVFTLLMGWAFMRSAEGDTRRASSGSKPDREQGPVIDTEAEVVEDEEKN